MKPTIGMTADNRIKPALSRKEQSAFGKPKGLMYILRVVTVPQGVALALITLIQLMRPQYVGGTVNLICAYLFLAVLPLLSYPIHATVPALKAKGRKAQRNLALVFSVTGYVAGTIVSLATDAPHELTSVYLTYLFTGIMLAAFTFGMKFKASGHASGIAGPITTLAYFVHPMFILAYALVLPVMWSSVKSSRHTYSEFLVGCLCPIVAFMFALLISAVL